MGEADLTAGWSHSDVLKLIMKVCNDGIKMGDHKRLKSQTLRFTNFQTMLYYSP